MSLLIAALVCSQVVVPPGTAISFGDVDRQQYPASVGAIAWKADGGLGAIWLDGRRGLGKAALTSPLDLWGAKLVAGRLEPLGRTGVLLSAARPLVAIESPAIAFNSGVVAIVWIERSVSTTTVHLVLGDEDDASIFAAPRVLVVSAGLTGVTVSAVGAGFIVAWTEGSMVSWVRLSPGQLDVTGVVPVPGGHTVSRPLVAGLADGGASFAYGSSPGPRAGLFNLAFSTPSDAGGLFETGGALAGIGFQGATPSLIFRISAGMYSSSAQGNFIRLTETRALSGCLASGNEALTAVAFTDLANASQVGFITQGGVNMLAAPYGEPVAVAANSTHGAFLRNFNGLSVVTRNATSGIVSTPIELTLAQPTQRTPSVAWLPNAGGFVVAYEQRGASLSVSQTWTGRLALVRFDGGVEDLGTTGAPQVLQVSPRVVEWDDTSVGVENQDAWARGHRVFSAPGFAAPSTIAGLDWRSSAGPPLLRWREQVRGQTLLEQTMGLGMVPITAPRCATSVNGRHYLGGWNGAALQYFEVQGISPAPNPIMVPANVMARGSMCITRGRGSAEVLATWSQGDSIRVLPLNAPGAPDLTISATAAAPFENPVAARLGSGVLVVWEKPPSYTSIGAAFVDDSAPTTAVPVNLRSGNELLRHPTVSAAPGGPALVVWQEFDSSPGVGATRVRARLVFPADGGAVDAGEADAGQLPGLDGGAARGVMLVFEPTCGCSGTGAKALLLLVAGLMTRRRARRVRS